MNCIFEHSDQTYLFIECVPQDGEMLGFPIAHLLRYSFRTTPDLLPASLESPPEQLTLEFSSCQVTITGWQLEPVLRMLRRGRAFTAKAADSRYRNLDPKLPFVREISVSNSR